MQRLHLINNELFVLIRLNIEAWVIYKKIYSPTGFFHIRLIGNCKNDTYSVKYNH